MSRIDELNSEINALTAQLRTLTAERDALLIAAQNPFPIGSVIGWGRGNANSRRGRVVEHRLDYKSVEYRVVNIRRDGSEGDTVAVRDYDHPHLIAEEYEEGKSYAPTPNAEQRPLKELAAGIQNHLERLEAADTAKRGREGRAAYYGAGTWVNGRYVAVMYVSYQGKTNLTREEAGCYLDWLNAGNEGSHYEALKEVTA